MRNRLNYGMVGGGKGSFIGDVHRKAANFDDLCTLAAGCFSRDFANTLATGAAWGVDPSRLYSDYAVMAEAEASRGDGIDFVIIVTPNDSHYPIAKAFLERGIHVVCDKPLTISHREALDLRKIALDRRLLCCVTYANTGYAMVKKAREILASGELGGIFMVMAEYAQSWLCARDDGANSETLWRLDPARQGPSCCVADVGTHVENLVSYMTGLSVRALWARLNVIGEGRTLDTNASMILEFSNGATGNFWCSQVAPGCDNALRVRVFCAKGSVEWEQEDPEHLRIARPGQAVSLLSKGGGNLGGGAVPAARIPAGHPEGTYEAFSNLYRSYARALIDVLDGSASVDDEFDFPSLGAGVSGMRFIEAALESSANGMVRIEL